MNYPVAQVGASAPSFEMQTTHGFRSLENFKGTWLVLFTYVADFSPVCTSEVLAFAQNYNWFREKNCEILGLSLDTIEIHNHWVNHLNNFYGIQVQFPLGESLNDPSMFGYGLLTETHENSSDESYLIRSTAIIDPEGILRSIQYYPPNNGRSITEVIRLLNSLQAYERYGINTPEGWQPSEKNWVPPSEFTNSRFWMVEINEKGESDPWPPEYWFY